MNWLKVVYRVVSACPTVKSVKRLFPKLAVKQFPVFAFVSVVSLSWKSSRNMPAAIIVVTVKTVSCGDLWILT